VTLTNKPGGNISFFNRISLVDPESKNRILPVFYSDNYVSVLPGEQKIITIDYNPADGKKNMVVDLYGWNVQQKQIPISN
jgi:mannosylglycoprotein endo-beta-mannosidase